MKFNYILIPQPNDFIGRSNLLSFTNYSYAQEFVRLYFEIVNIHVNKKNINMVLNLYIFIFLIFVNSYNCLNSAKLTITGLVCSTNQNNPCNKNK